MHVDVKKLPAIPDGGGWRTHGRGNAGPRQRAGWRYVHSAIDDRTRRGFTAAGFWRRAAAFYALAGIACERVLTDNGPCYRSKDFLTALKDTRTSPRRTRPYRPQTNGKVERRSTRNGPTPATGTTTVIATTMNTGPTEPNGTPRWPPSPA